MSDERQGPLEGGTRRTDCDDAVTGRKLIVVVTAAGAEGGPTRHAPTAPATSSTTITPNSHRSRKPEGGCFVPGWGAVMLSERAFPNVTTRTGQAIVPATRRRGRRVRRW